MTGPTTSPPTVTVHAVAEREVEPDSFVLGLNVTAEGLDQAAATALLLTRYEAVSDALTPPPDRTDLRHGPVQSWGEGGRKPWFHANRTLTVSGSDLAALPALVSSVAELDGVGIQGPEWGISRGNPVHVQLQAQAVHEARTRAERYAQALDGTLGRIVELRDPGAGSGAVAMYRVESASAASLDLSPQKVSINAMVDATWFLDLPE